MPTHPHPNPVDARRFLKSVETKRRAAKGKGNEATLSGASNSVFGSKIPPNTISQVAEDIPSNLYCVDVKYCMDMKSSSRASAQRREETIDRTNDGAGVKSSQPPRQRKRAGAIGPTTYRRADSSRHPSLENWLDPFDASYKDIHG